MDKFRAKVYSSNMLALKIGVQWGSKYWNCLIFKYPTATQSLNDLSIKWHLNIGALVRSFWFGYQVLAWIPAQKHLKRLKASWEDLNPRHIKVQYSDVLIMSVSGIHDVPTLVSLLILDLWLPSLRDQSKMECYNTHLEGQLSFFAAFYFTCLELLSSLRG